MKKYIYTERNGIYIIDLKKTLRLMREAHPGLPVIAYVNTSAAVKAEVDICCTSGKAKTVVESFGVPKVIGGNTNVLAVDIYKQVIGQQNFSMGAVVGEKITRCLQDAVRHREAAIILSRSGGISIGNVLRR